MNNLDPRDRILQLQTPAVMVPRYGELPPMEKSGHRYLVAENGLWLEVKRPWLHARVPLPEYLPDAVDGHPHPLPFGRVEQLVQYAITPDDLVDLQERFLVDAARAMPNECAAWGVYDDLTGAIEYSPCIALEASAGGISFHRPTLGLNEHFAVDLHSHGALQAFFSATDDEDDRGEVKIACVAGTLDEAPTWATRLCLLGIFIDSARACRVCGCCTEERACPGGCEWIEPDLCSRCV